MISNQQSNAIHQVNVRLDDDLIEFAEAAAEMDGHPRVSKYVLGLVQKDFNERCTEVADFLRHKSLALEEVATRLEQGIPHSTG